LSDWAYYLLLQTVVDKFYGKYNNEGSLVLAFLFTQSGYKARMLHDEQQLYTTVACHHLIFGKSYTIAGGEYYYVLDGRKLPQSVYVCMAKFPQEGSMSLQMSAVQKFALNKTPQRTITSKKNNDFSFTISSNKNYLDFYTTYPRSTVDNNFMTQWVMYAETPLEKGVRDQLYPAISEKIKGLSQLEAVQQILWWVQTGFEYDYDDNVWGEDRPFFGEESIFYPYCDCEDRSILFSHLVRDLVGLDVALVYYPGHLATAVAFTNKVSGDYYVGKDGRHFTVCDPTFINSRVGRTMTSVKGDPATIMELRR
jgi:hypothetical protein